MFNEKFNSEHEQIEIPQKSPELEPKQFFNEDFIQCFLALKSPLLYRQYKIAKGDKDPLLKFIQHYNQAVNLASKIKKMYKSRNRPITKKKNIKKQSKKDLKFEELIKDWGENVIEYFSNEQLKRNYQMINQKREMIEAENNIQENYWRKRKSQDNDNYFRRKRRNKKELIFNFFPFW